MPTTIPPQGVGISEFDISHYKRIGTTSDIYYSVISTGVTTATKAVLANNIYTVPLIITKISTLDSIAIHVSTLGAGNARIGIYDDNGNLYPNNLILDAGTVDVSSTGVKTIAISRTLNKGLYWLCMVSNVAATLKAAIETVCMLGFSNTDFQNPRVSWLVAFTYAALPATFPAGGTAQTGDQPLIAVRLT